MPEPIGPPTAYDTTSGPLQLPAAHGSGGGGGAAPTWGGVAPVAALAIVSLPTAIRGISPCANIAR